MHARFEQTSQLSGACTTSDREAGKCYGGFPRVAHVVKEARKAAASGEGPPVLYLNAGDTYTGTAWFTIYKWKVAAEFLNALQPDAVSLGGNDFEKDSAQLSPLLKSISTPILATNIILNTEEKERLQKSVVFNVKGYKVGIVGFVTPELSTLDNAGAVEYIDEVIALQEEVNKLKEQNVSIVIALGHANIDKVTEIAAEVDGIDLIINGYKNVYGSNGNTKNLQDEVENVITVTQQSGKKVPIVQSFAYNKNLGKVLAKFNSNGELSDYQAEQMPLDFSVPQDTNALAIMKTYMADIDLLSQEVIGSTAVVLDGDTCKAEECNFGNLITDSMMYYYSIRHQGDRWTDAPIAMIHSSAITTSIAPQNRPAAVTKRALLSAIQSEGNLVAVTMTGTVLKQVLEHSVADYRSINPSGRFLQYSGIRVTYDIANAPGSRIVDAVVRCGACSIPEFQAINDSTEYSILMPLSLANGAEGYSMLIGLPRRFLDFDEAFGAEKYIAQRSPVYPEVSGRIVLLNPEKASSSAPTIGTSITLLSLGNHEFDNGVSGLTPFIENLTCPVLAANLILNREPSLQAQKNLMKSITLDINGTKIGIIGYLTPDTKILAIRNNVEYIDEEIAIRNEIAELKRQNVKIFIALGHSGYLKDLKIAKIEDIDLVIGGHTNTFLWEGKTIDSEKVDGPYPSLVKQTSGKIVPVVQAYAYTKYLGKLRIVFNSSGDIISFNGNPILLDNSIPQDADILEIVNKYRKNVAKLTEVVVGKVSVVLDGQSCRLMECNMGNLITDAMVYKYASEYDGKGWTDAPIAIIQGGGIRASIAHTNLPTNITKGDLLIVMPFDGNMVKLSINGSNIWKMLEHSVAGYLPLRSPGEFLQFSGLKVEYDFEKPPGMRVKSSLGNHEFDNGVSGLTPFIQNLTTPVLAANLKLNNVPELAAEANLRKSVVFNVSDVAVGVIGYLTPETKVLAVHNNVEYIDEIVALKDEVKNLKNEGVNIIIALGHSGYLKDLEIAKAVDGIDLVIGGHSNTFLWNGTTPDSDEIQGPYPTYVTQASGKQVPVVQAYAYTKYLGRLHMVFDSNGDVINIDGNPILLDNSIPQDPELLQIVERYRRDILNITEEVLGQTSVVLDGLSCQNKECNLGNLIADAMVFRYATDYKGKYWTDAPIAAIQGGGIRSSIANTKAPTNITKGDLLGVMPFEGILVTAEMSGTVLLQMLEYGVSNYDPLDYPGEFLQVSGIKVVFDLRRPSGSRIVKAEARCGLCDIPSYSDIKPDQIYKIIMPNFLAQGGDGYWMFKGLPIHTLNYNEHAATVFYVTHHKLIYHGVEGRVTLIEGNESKSISNAPSLFILITCLGNHEFDEDVEGVVPFIKNLTTPVLAANLILDKVPELQNITNLYKSIILLKKGVKIGVIGYLTPDTKFLAPKNNVDYEDEIPAIRREVNLLREKGVNIILALGHSGFLKDIEIAKEVDGLDLVIGGHSNTFLWNGEHFTESPEHPQGLYPTMIKQSSGRIVPVVQAYAYTKYLGKLHLVFDSKGEILKCFGDPILLHQGIPNDEEVLTIIKRYRGDIDRINNEIIGSSLIFLDGEQCRLRECNLGNLITDATLNYTKRISKDKYADVNIVFIQGGRIRSSLGRSETPYNITRGDFITVLPFSDTLSVVTMNGSMLIQALEHSVASWRTIDSPGQFLQLTGVEVTYDLSKEPGGRVKVVKAICTECSALDEVRDYLTYKVYFNSCRIHSETYIYNSLAEFDALFA
ncbi:Protein 5NUC [Papilio machaon]|uniref:5'-nucleotidase n=1 Tax=Papilio machaon TaxID=76193 RepID=A0A0N1IPH3_PAPMA|nr:Protein 5NUC [Papilio machaon]